MELKKRKMVTIVAESSIEAPIIKSIKRQGARGYTLIGAQGEGSRGVRQGDWDQARNIFIQTICSAERAHAIMDSLYEEFYDDYAIIAYLTDIEVHRENKF